MDFSEVEWNGFINGFISFWQGWDDDVRNEIDLCEAAKQVLRGCKKHFHAGVTRLSRINGVILPATRDILNELWDLLLPQHMWNSWNTHV
jgi:hypothetical protein